jgi:hypothetical protein
MKISKCHTSDTASERKRPHEIPKHRLEDNIEMGNKELG